MRLVVRREGVHGMPVEEYAAALRERVDDDVDVALARTPDQERDLLPDADVVTGPRLGADLLATTDDLELFACAYAGTDHLPLEELRERGVAVTSASGVHAPNVAEYAVGSILAFVRRFRESWRREERREWRPLHAGELQGATVTVVGLGAIGAAVCERLDPFGVETVGVRASPEKGGPADEVAGPDALHDALARSRFLVLTCPLTEETRGLVGREEFVTMPPDAVLVNVARGGVVETDALVDALRRNEIRGAALDVTDPEPLPEDHPLWGFEDAQVTPHNAGQTPRYYDRLADIVADNVGRLAADEELRNRVT